MKYVFLPVSSPGLMDSSCVAAVRLSDRFLAYAKKLYTAYQAAHQVLGGEDPWGVECFTNFAAFVNKTDLIDAMPDENEESTRLAGVLEDWDEGKLLIVDDPAGVVGRALEETEEANGAEMHCVIACDKELVFNAKTESGGEMESADLPYSTLALHETLQA